MQKTHGCSAIRRFFCKYVKIYVDNIFHKGRFSTSQYPETFDVTLYTNFGESSINIGTLYGRSFLDAFVQNNCGNGTFFLVEKHRMERMEDGTTGSVWGGNEIHCSEEDAPRVIQMIKKRPTVMKRKLVSWSKTAEHGTWVATITDNV